MVRETAYLLERIQECLKNMNNAEAVYMWNMYCNDCGDYDRRIKDMYDLLELFDISTTDGIINLLNRFYFGQDGENESNGANPNRNYFYFDGRRNIVSINNPLDAIKVDELARYIAENNKSFRSDEIQKILDGKDEE